MSALQGESVEDLKAKIQALSTASMKIGETLSQQSQSSSSSSSSSSGDAGSSDKK
jgi:molecular chaperone DnaK